MLYENQMIIYTNMLKNKTFIKILISLNSIIIRSVNALVNVLPITPKNNNPRNEIQGDKSKDELIIRIIQIGGNFLLNYIRYCFLTGSVFFTLAALLFIILNLNLNFSFGFLKLFSFIDLVFGTDTFDLDLRKIMQIFSAASLILLIIVDSTKIVLRTLFNLNVGIKPKSKKIVIFSTATLVYFLAILIVSFDQTLDKNLILIFSIFYFGNLLSLAGYFALKF